MAAEDHVFSLESGKRYRFPTHVNDLILDRSQAERCEIFVVVLEEGESPPLHKHPEMEQVYYMIEGTGILHMGKAGRSKAKVSPGKVIHVPRNMPHSLSNTGKGVVRYLAVDVFVRRKASEPTWDSHVRNVCAQFGWDIDECRPRGYSRKSRAKK